MFLANHQNALMDALLIATTNARYTHFLARADLFQNRFIRFLLSAINMKPVYRIRDGWSNLSLNSRTFEYCDEALAQGDALLLFPEGNHDLKRRLRPLSKGFTRIIDRALKTNSSLDLKIVPVGINYSNPQRVWSGVSLYYGAPVHLKDFLATNEIRTLRDEVSVRLKQLITHIDDVENYESQIHFLESRGIDFLDPEKSNFLLSNIAMHVVSVNTKKSSTSIFSLIPLALNFFPGLTWILIKRRIKDPVFIATIRFAITITLFPINILIQGAVLWMISPIASIGISIAAVLSLPAYGFLQRKG
jgi:1-acyl-sn-glycerol-3-phosphate acyltransferase